MSEVISLREAKYSLAPSNRTASGKSGAAIYHLAGAIAPGEPGHSFSENIRRAILLLDVSVQQVRLLVRQIADPSRRKGFEAQIDTLEHLLLRARQMASRF